ncbi:MAG: glycoside hydrolase family 3 C-terminal domain-containing protein [Bacteroidota bacterium]|nr:glycoside hydrolase family 3 C-terminal domain-containing protein [Bacteroidota bacterium]
MKKNIIYIVSLLIGGLCVIPGVANAQQKQDKAEEILSKMTPEEKIKEIYGVDDFLQYLFKSMINKGLTNKSSISCSGGNKKLGIPQLLYTDGHKGVKDAGRWTAFPATSLRGATFDKELENRVGKAIATEMEASGGTAFGGLTLNLLRNPKGGRSEESYGEDSYLAGALGTELTKGVKSTGKVMALAKHFALNSIENVRFDVSANVSERALREVYLPQFRMVVQDGHLDAMMSAYNKVNGVYCGENKHLLTDILRNEWGFNGFVISDWENGIYHTVPSIKAGVNIEMPMSHFYSQDSIMAAIDRKEITWGDIDALVLQVLRKKLEIGVNNPHRLDRNVRHNNEAVSQEAAEKGMVLLKNDGVLPFSTSKIKNILLVGELAKYHNLGELGHIPDVPNYKRITPYKGLTSFLKDSKVAVWYTDGKNKEEFEKLASRADAIVVCAGFTSLDQGENMHFSEGTSIMPLVGSGDRYDMNLHQDDINLINLSRRFCSNTAVVLFGGGTPVVDQWINRAPALLVAGIPGQNGGYALANILFGKVNPSGKLPYSIYKNENDYPAIPYSQLYGQDPWDVKDNRFQNPFNVDYGYYIGYTLAEKKNIPVSFPFGYGLSYTKFAFGNPSTDKSAYGENDVIKVNVEVANTGKMNGGEVVQVYAGFENAKVDRPVKALKGFEKIYLNPGESRMVQVEVPVKELAYWDVDSKSLKVEKINYTLYVGSSSKTEDLQKVQVSVQ